NRIFIPFAPNAPPTWLMQVIEDSGAQHIIVDRSTRSELADIGGVTVLDVERLAQSSETFAADQIASPGDPAYIVYTSGSTGRPKGVAITHRSSIHRTAVRSSLFGIGRSDRCTNFRATGVAAEINNIFLPLLSGASVFPFDLQRHGLQRLAPWLIAQKITY